jgi:hypothetical protein
MEALVYLAPTLQAAAHVIRPQMLVFHAIAVITWQILALVYPAQPLPAVKPAINLKMLVTPVIPGTISHPQLYAAPARR